MLATALDVDPGVSISPAISGLLGEVTVALGTLATVTGISCVDGVTAVWLALAAVRTGPGGVSVFKDRCFCSYSFSVQCLTIYM